MTPDPVLFAALGLALSLLLGAQLARQRRGRPQLERIGWFCAPILIALLLILLWMNLCGIPDLDWNSARVAPAFALAKGINFYGAPGAGPYLDWMYGPVLPLLLLPLAALKSITAVLLGAGAICQLCALAPLFAAQPWRRGQPGANLIALLGGLFAAFALFLNWPTLSLLCIVHVDAVSVGLGLCSCLVLSGGSGAAPGWGRLLSAAALASLSVWAKQIAAPLFLAQILYLACARGWHGAGRYIAASLLAGGAISAVILAGFGPDRILYNLFWIPAHQAINPGWWRAMYWECLMCAPFVVLLLLAGLDEAAAGSAGFREFARANPWLLPAAVAILLLPLGAVSALKINGGMNSYHSLYYFIAAASAALSRRAQTSLHGSARLRWAPVLPALVLLSAAVGTVNALTIGSKAPGLVPSPRAAQAWQLAAAHGGEIWLPWDPLATLMTEGKLYPFDDALLNLFYAHVEPTAAQVRAVLPPRLRYVAYGPGVQSKTALYFLPEFSRESDLSGWKIFTRAPASAASAALAHGRP